MKTIEAVTEIDAPVRAVWAELSAVSTYGEWNPFITSFKGELVVGTRAEVRIAPPGGRPMTFRPTITAVDEERRLEWLGRLLAPGVFDGRHSFLLEDLGQGRTRLTQTEAFSGLLVSLVGRTLERTADGFKEMNQAIRVRAEAATTTSTDR